jgi:hypothetical protein
VLFSFLDDECQELNNSMSKYYVYQLVDPRNNKPFYIGKGTGDRAYQHLKFKDGNNNLYKDRKIKSILKENLEIVVEFLYKDLADENTAYDLEEKVIKKIGIKNLTNIAEDRRPPSKKGWTPSKETLEKRSKSLKGIARSEEWCRNLSLAKQGINNPMYGKKNPCSEDKQLSIIRTKNLPNYDLYKQAIKLMNSGKSADTVATQLGIGRGVCFKLKNRSHLFFKAFPELI